MESEFWHYSCNCVPNKEKKHMPIRSWYTYHVSFFPSNLHYVKNVPCVNRCTTAHLCAATTLFVIIMHLFAS